MLIVNQYELPNMTIDSTWSQDRNPFTGVPRCQHVFTDRHGVEHHCILPAHNYSDSGCIEVKDGVVTAIWCSYWVDNEEYAGHAHPMRFDHLVPDVPRVQWASYLFGLNACGRNQPRADSPNRTFGCSHHCPDDTCVAISGSNLLGACSKAYLDRIDRFRTGQDPDEEDTDNPEMAELAAAAEAFLQRLVTPTE